MKIDNFHEKITLILSFLILNNYLFLSLNFSQLFIKINFLVFVAIISLFYFKNILENIYLKIFFLFILLISLGTPLFDWDPRSTWLFHAKRIFYDQSIFSIADNYANFSNNDYPNLAPAFASSLAVLFGYWNEVLPKIAFLLMFLPPLIFVYVFFNKTEYLIFLSIVFFTIGKYLFNGWADGLVAVYFCLSAFLFYILIITDNNLYKKNLTFYLIAFCFFVTLTLSKNEGTVLLPILFLTATFVLLLKSKIKQNIFKIVFLSIAFIPVFLWKYFCYTNEISNNLINDDTILNLTLRLTNFESYKMISYFIFLNEKFLVSIFLFLTSFYIVRNKELFTFISISTLIYIFVLFFMYLSTPFDLYFQLNSTVARVIKTLNFTLCFFALYNLSIANKFK